MRRSGYNFHNFIHIKYDNVMIVCRSLELVFFPISCRATFGLLFFFSSAPLSPVPRLRQYCLVLSRELVAAKNFTHTFLSLAIKMVIFCKEWKLIRHSEIFFSLIKNENVKHDDGNIGNAGGKIIIIMSYT